ncbi:MAG: regulatory protein RecX [Fimbriimonadaceae bacterium]|nr:MAG: regulatory protein RecX [Fimbriimonadaceae bacterium]
MNKPRPSALDAALRYLKRSERSEAEIRLFLAQKEYPQSEINEGVGSLKQYGYLDDQGLAKRIIEFKQKKLVGDLVIQQTLDQKGLEAEIDSEDGVTRAKKLLSLKFHTDQDTNDPKVIGKAARLLGSRGFREDEIREALESHFKNFEAGF